MLPKLIIEDFTRVNTEIKYPVTKFGGQPVWLTEPQWPISTGWDNRPMMFIAQIALDKRVFSNSNGEVAYIFVTHPETLEDDFFDPEIIYPDEGENAIIIQPGGQLFVKTENIINGPTIFDHNGLGYEGYAKLTFSEDPDFVDNRAFKLLSEKEKKKYCSKIEGSKLGGSPYFFQGDQWPEGKEWSLLMQLNSTFLPFYLNLGAAPTLFAFISNDYKKGKLLIQDI